MTTKTHTKQVSICWYGRANTVGRYLTKSERIFVYIIVENKSANGQDIVSILAHSIIPIHGHIVSVLTHTCSIIQIHGHSVSIIAHSIICKNGHTVCVLTYSIICT